MSEQHADRNQRLKATMREVETPLNRSGKEGGKVCSPSQGAGIKKPIGHIDPYRK
jgi:hypothetical protein